MFAEHERGGTRLYVTNSLELKERVDKDGLCLDTEEVEFFMCILSHLAFHLLLQIGPL